MVNFVDFDHALSAAAGEYTYIEYIPLWHLVEVVCIDPLAAVEAVHHV